MNLESVSPVISSIQFEENEVEIIKSNPLSADAAAPDIKQVKNEESTLIITSVTSNALPTSPRSVLRRNKALQNHRKCSRTYKCKHCNYRAVSYSNIANHLKYIHPRLVKHGGLYQHYKTTANAQGIKRVPLMYFCPHCNYITLNLRGLMLHCNKSHPKRKVNPFKQGSPITTIANKKYLEALCISNEEPKKSKAKALKLLSMFHPNSLLLDTSNKSTSVSCAVCKKQYPNAVSLSRHCEISHTHKKFRKDAVMKKFNCKLCSHEYSSRSALSEHYSEAHYISIYNSYDASLFTLPKRKNSVKRKMYDVDSTHVMLERMDKSLLLLMHWNCANDLYSADYPIPCIACDFSSTNLILLLKHYRHYHRCCFPKGFQLFLIGKLQSHIKSIIPSASSAKFIQNEDVVWLTDNHQLTQYFEYTCKICDFKSDWFSQMYNHVKGEHSNKKFSLDFIEKSISNVPYSLFSSFLLCSMCYHVELTHNGMITHYKVAHGENFPSIESDDIHSSSEMKVCDDCDFIGNYDSILWHCIETHGYDNISWTSLRTVTEFSYEDVLCRVCQYKPSDDMDLIAHYEKFHLDDSISFSYSISDNCYQCLSCGSEMLSLQDIASHCDCCMKSKIIQTLEPSKEMFKYSSCKICFKVFNYYVTKEQIWKHVLEEHYASSLPFTMGEVQSYALKYGYWKLGDSASTNKRARKTCMPGKLQSIRSYSSVNTHYNETVTEILSVSEESPVTECDSQKPISDIVDVEEQNNIISQSACQVETILSDDPSVCENNALAISENCSVVSSADDDVMLVSENPTGGGGNTPVLEKSYSLKDTHLHGEEIYAADNCSQNSPSEHGSPSVVTIGDTMSPKKRQSARKSHSKRVFVTTYKMCKFCFCRIGKEYSLRKHLEQKHKVEMSLRCFHCDEKFLNAAECIRHHEIIHGIRLDQWTAFNFLQEDIARGLLQSESYICVWCGYESHSKTIVLNHFNSIHISNSRRKRRHLKNGSYLCRWCDYATKNITSMRAHVSDKHDKVISYHSLENFSTEEKMASDSSDSSSCNDHCSPKQNATSQKIRQKTFSLIQYCKFIEESSSDVKIFESTHNRYYHQNHYPFVCGYCSKCYVCSHSFFHHCMTEHKDYCNVQITHEHVILLPEPSKILHLQKKLCRYHDRLNAKSVFYGDCRPCIMCTKQCKTLVEFQEHVFECHNGMKTLICQYCDYVSMQGKDIMEHLKCHTEAMARRKSEKAQNENIDWNSRISQSVSTTSTRVKQKARKSIRSSTHQAVFPGVKKILKSPSCSVALPSDSPSDESADLYHENQTMKKEDLNGKSFSCKFCHYSCNDLGTLNDHLADFHKIEKSYQFGIHSDEIGSHKETTVSKNNAANEVIYIPDSDEEADDCDQLPTFQNSVTKKDVDENPQVCPYCGYESTSSRQLKSHMQRHEI